MKLEYLQSFRFSGQAVDKSSSLKYFPVSVFMRDPNVSQITCASLYERVHEGRK